MTMTLEKLARHVALALNEESAAWDDFVDSCYAKYEISPWIKKAANIEPSQDFVDYWMNVARSTLIQTITEL